MSTNPSPWARYRPTSIAPWNLERAWTLRRRAGFAATWRELERDVADGPGPAVDRVLAGECRSDGIPAEFARTADLLGDAAAGATDARRLQAWWLYRALFTPDPLCERLTLMWHDHFATSQRKVDDVAAMRAQSETFRRLGRGPFGTLLREMLRDPALLDWLDAPSNRKGKPNENLARELLELFTLGLGRYTEHDVKETARALTGLSVVQGQFQLRIQDHDDGEKTVLDKTARFDVDSLAELLVSQPAAADRLAWRICATFLGEGVADDDALRKLANQLRGDELHVGRGVETVLRSELFYSARNLHARVSDPVGFVVGTLRALERFDPPPSTLLLAEWTARLGQELFYPPNVGGWPGGRGWLTGRAVVARANFAAALVAGHLNSDVTLPDLAGLAERRVHTHDPREALGFFGELLTGRTPEQATGQSLWQSAQALGGSKPERINQGVALLLARPEAQLC
jgi:uncharacterized protein (DUF1800 family)